jgi:DNA-directed RNA polymerase subunit omega
MNMMLEPSIDALIEKIDSKYMLVTLSAKRARQLQNEDAQKHDEAPSRKYVGVALEEIMEGKLTYKTE